MRLSQLIDLFVSEVCAGKTNQTPIAYRSKLIRHVSNAIHWDRIAAPDLVPDSLHVVDLRGALTNSYFGLALLYSGNADLTINYADGVRFIALPELPQGLIDTGYQVATWHYFFLPLVRR